jgi:hypothetical protein
MQRPYRRPGDRRRTVGDLRWPRPSRCRGQQHSAFAAFPRHSSALRIEERAGIAPLGGLLPTDESGARTVSEARERPTRAARGRPSGSSTLQRPRLARVARRHDRRRLPLPQWHSSGSQWQKPWTLTDLSGSTAHEATIRVPHGYAVSDSTMRWARRDLNPRP